MEGKELNSGVVFTNEKCIGCNRCISGCVAVGANVVVQDENADRYSVLVDPNKCILCGSCVQACVHKARTYRDDTDAFFEALQNGEEISILVSPTLLTNYEKQYHNILGYLQHRGVRHIYNTGFGGDIMVWVYMNFIHSFGLSGVISQCCPVIVNYLEKYRPELLPSLMPVQSPAMCTAIYVSDYLKIKDKLAYISPCIASKQEIGDVNTYGRVSYNVTIERLMERLQDEDLSQYNAEDEVVYGLGALISMPSGLSDNMERYIGFNEVLIQTEGPTNIFPYFEHYYKEVAAGETLPFLVDALSCTHGCNFGTGTQGGAELRNEMTFSAHRVKENAYTSGVVAQGNTHQKRLELLDERFKDFELSSFVRQYDATRKEPEAMLTPELTEAIYQSMYKHTQEQRTTDCGSCGYTTCKAMVQAVGAGVNIKENCINYSKECIRLETEKINALLAEISNMNEELKRSTQLKSNFLANMSHEIRTPMNAIIGMAEIALRGSLQSEERQYIQQIQSSGRSLLAIINDILDFSKIESGKMELSPSEYRVMSVINDTVNMINTRIGEKDISLMVNADPNIPNTLYGDDIRIKQILVNLANNAIKFTDKGCVEIILGHTRTDQGIQLSVSVRDTGMGIREEDLSKLFSSFQQVDSKRNRNVEGTGLGLAISREFVSLMQGSIGIESTYGKGSTFSFVIPQQVVEDQPSISLKATGVVKTASMIVQRYHLQGYLQAVAALKQVENTACNSLEELQAALAAGVEFVFVEYDLWTPELDAYAQQHPQLEWAILVDPRKHTIAAPYIRRVHLPVYSLNVAAILNCEAISHFDGQAQGHEFRFEAPEANILIVDDNAINLTVAMGLLGPLHMQMTGAAGALEAIALIRKNQYDIVFMDHMMPEIDGVEATHMIRALGEQYQTLPIIALTANATSNARDMFLQEGMDDFIAKPIEMVDMTTKLLRWLPPEKIRELGKKADPANGQEPALCIPGLDTAAGIGFSGSEKLYRTILNDYYKVIGAKADLIRQYWQEENIAAYTVEVHALKSASRLIGATALADLAARLEKCGHDGAWEAIREETPMLLEQYRGYLDILQPYVAPQREITDCSMEVPALQEALEALRAALEDFDLDGAVALCGQLQACDWPPPADALCSRLLQAVEAMEYEEAAAIALQWEELLTTTIE